MSIDTPNAVTRRALLQLAGGLAIAGSLSVDARAQAPVAKLKIGVVGSGRVGSALGAAWIKAGHEVMFSSLDLEHDKKLAGGLGPNAKAGSTKEAASFGSVVLVSVPYQALPGIGKEIGEVLKGKVVIDTSNPIVARDGDMAVAAREKGAGLATLEFLPGARIVRAFNAIGFAKMADAAAKKEGFGMPMAGDDAGAIAIASGLVRDVGYEPVLVGPLATMGKYLIPGSPLAGERTADEIRKVAATLK